MEEDKEVRKFDLKFKGWHIEREEWIDDRMLAIDNEGECLSAKYEQWPFSIYPTPTFGGYYNVSEKENESVVLFQLLGKEEDKKIVFVHKSKWKNIKSGLKKTLVFDLEKIWGHNIKIINY